MPAVLAAVEMHAEIATVSLPAIASEAVSVGARTRDQPQGVEFVRMAVMSTAGLRSIGAGQRSVPLLFGVSTTDGFAAGPARELEHALGVAPGLIMTYCQFATAVDFPFALATAVARRGAVPEVTWEPWDASSGVEQPAYRLTEISGGRFDRYLLRWADQITEYGRPLRLRFAHEMNGDWYPWAERMNGNRRGDYVRAWRHVHGLFSGVRNISWVWSPNVTSAGLPDLEGLYPGDSYVDAVGVDGYNWGTAVPGQSWKAFDDIFSPTLSRIRRFTSRPLFASEVACTEVGGNKPAWIIDFFAGLEQNPDIRGFTWFHHNKETDWRINSSAAALRSFAAGLAGFGREAASSPE